MTKLATTNRMLILGVLFGAPLAEAGYSRPSFGRASVSNYASFRRSYPPSMLDLRGGSTAATDDDEDEDEDAEHEEADITSHPEFKALQSYRMQQQVLLQLRSTFLSEALAKRGIPMPTIVDVSTPEGSNPPQSVDWDCAMSTEEDPKSCLFSFDAEPGTKVVAPLNSTNWIGLATLNRLRREDPTKVEPMWHSKYSILKSWFDPESEYSLLQHVGVQGFFLNALLQGYRLQMTLFFTLMVVGVMFMPILEYFVNRFLVSSLVWTSYPRWYRFVHAALPLKIFMAQMAFGYAAKGFGKLSSFVKDMLVEWECSILEQSIPLTVGVPDMVPPSRRTEPVGSDSDFFDDDAIEEDEISDQEEDDEDDLGFDSDDE
mmetsp:Transcript_61377/g.176664  ORF Transcript_61377/g.176664 Transcript_61377/m.176664 type:complete len:373 (-) Transcript_61377:31-1149(-)